MKMRKGLGWGSYRSTPAGSIHFKSKPQANREVFELLQKAGLLQASTCCAMVRMTGFRNIAIHEYQQLDMKIVRAIIEKHLLDFQTANATF